MLDFDTCQRLYDAIPAFREHVPTSGDWSFTDADAPARPVLIDTDGSMLVQDADDEPGVLHRDIPEGRAPTPFCWCPTLSDLIALAIPFGLAKLQRGSGPVGTIWLDSPDDWAVCGNGRAYGGATPDKALAHWLLEEAKRDDG